ncbi:ABC transporter substrate-binding protein [Jiella mangrovi]|uniref:ABC transporter substrate-binding protein n=1 Tax=Jiella mangrovi TaxID=2821407 RepID=A0ABS4BCE0_9HYPH|nr:ABC transporter substrate-binding protein [Jiella mangrovi]MBP0614412.1 ABC transporter substrate-binding protein [Jiella mangrovi]
MTRDTGEKIDHKAVLAAQLSNRIGRRSFLKGVGVGAGALASAGLGLTPDLARADQAGHIRIASLSHIDTLDPHFTFFLSAVQIINNIHNGLLKVTFDGEAVKFEPDLAASWDMEDDTTHLFKLHEGVKFHDGTACDAEAVKYSLMRVKSGDPKSPHAWKLELLDEIEIVDPLTLRLKFSKPYAFLPVALTGSTGRAGTIVSPAAVEKYGMDYGRNPVGTGPFKFVSWKDNDSIELEANPDYFEAGMPKLAKASFMLINEPSTAVAALVSGQIEGMNDCPLQLVNQVKQVPTVNLYGGVEGNYTYVGMNTRKAPFDDVNLRRAVAFAIDRDAVVKQGYFGLAQEAYTPISPPMTGFYDPNIADSGRGQWFDLEKAKAFRAKAKTQGDIEVTYLMTEDGPGGTRVAQTLAPMLAEIGIKVKLELLEPAAWVKRMKDGDFEMLDFRWWADLDPEETLYPEFKSGGSWNYWGWDNAEFDRLCAEAGAIIDTEKRAELYRKAEDHLMDEAPVAMLAHIPVYKAFAKKVEGFQYVPCDLVNLHTVSIA